jgi:hypothetical protein
VGYCRSQETEDQARGGLLVTRLNIPYLIRHQSITVIPRKNRLRIYIDSQDKYYRLRELKRGLADVVVKVWFTPQSGFISIIPIYCQGVPTIQRAVINIKEKDDAKGKKGDKELLVEGYGLQKCMIAEGLRFTYIPLQTQHLDLIARRCWRAYVIQPCHRSRSGTRH